jgi:hypothetical protein
MKCFIDYDRAADYDRHSQSCFEFVHAELLRDEAPTRSCRFGSERWRRRRCGRKTSKRKAPELSRGPG